LAVVTVSCISIAVLIELSTLFLFLTISVGPVCSVTRPTGAAKLVGLIDSNRVTVTS
jgi:hypothetical protein